MSCSCGHCHDVPRHTQGFPQDSEDLESEALTDGGVHSERANDSSSVSPLSTPKVAFGIMGGGIMAWLNSLPIITRFVNIWLLAYFTFSTLGFVHSYVALDLFRVFDDYQIWRLITFAMSDSNLLSAVVCCVCLNDCVYRCEITLGSIHTAFLLIFNTFSTLISTVLLHTTICTRGDHNTDSKNNTYFGFDPDACNHMSWTGLYPTIFGLLIFESFVVLPSQRSPVFLDKCITVNTLHAPFWALLYTVFVRVDICVLLSLLISLLCAPRLSVELIEWMTSSCVCRRLAQHSMFVSLADIHPTEDTYARFPNRDPIMELAEHLERTMDEQRAADAELGCPHHTVINRNHSHEAQSDEVKRQREASE